MSERSAAFAKGGCGCLVAFLALGLLAVIAGGSVHLDCGGAGILFVIGGIIGLIFLAVYKKGAREGREQGAPPGTPPWWCRDCGCSNPIEAKLCQRCHAGR